MPESVDVIVIGAGAAGLMCAIAAGGRGRRVLVLDHANKAGKKILMSGGGRCNFTNYHIEPENFLSHNPHFCKSALSRFTQWDFINLVEKHQIPFHERDLGQLFCDDSAKDILNMLLTEARRARVELRLNTFISDVKAISNDKQSARFSLQTSSGDYHCNSVVVASGGLSIPRMSASPFGYQIAEQFGLKIHPTRAGLVPFTLQPEDKARLEVLSGIAQDSEVRTGQQSFRGNILFTHRGLSGPAILQLSSYWRGGDSVGIDLYPGHNVVDLLQGLQQQRPRLSLRSALSTVLAKRLVAVLFEQLPLDGALSSLSKKDLEVVADSVHQCQIVPAGTEGYRTAEVTLGGVDCDALSSKTLECRDVPGLYFIGEVVDVSGWLGGYNFQWAWSSGWCAGQYV